MDKLRNLRVLPLAIALIMILGTFSFSFATTDTGEGAPAGQELNDVNTPAGEEGANEQPDQGAENTDPANLGAQGENTEVTTPEVTPTDPAPVTPAPVTLAKNMTKVEVHPGYKSVTLRWKKVKGAKYYYIKIKAPKKKAKTKRIKATSKDYMTWTDKKVKLANKNYKYTVYATDGKIGNKATKKTKSKTVKGKSVRQMYQTIWLKYSVTLQSHGGGSGSRTFSSNQALVTTGFGGGKYKFWYKGKLYYCNSTRVRKAKCDYKKSLKNNYSVRSAENFINALQKKKKVKKSSRSQYLIWVSTYTQHLYVFKWNKKTKKWNVDRHWECATGKAGTPTRIDLSMSIERKQKWDGGIQWWNYFSTGNAIHGKRPSYVVDGAPHSSGCVRNLDKNAQWIWYNCPVGTPVAIY